MKQQRWEKKSLLGAELRDKTLGVVGFGRIGQAVAHRARAFGMRILAHDPFIAAHVADELDVELANLDELCARGRLHHAAPADDRADATSSSTRRGLRRARRASGSSTPRAAS